MYVLPVAAVRRLVLQMARKETIQIAWIEPGSSERPHAYQAGRFVCIEPIVDFRTAAIALHETAHAIQPLCPKTGPHHHDERLTSSFACLACEAAAWATAMTWFPFSRAMHDALTRSLNSYRRIIQAPEDTHAAAARLSGDAGWQAERQRQLRWQRRFEKLERLNFEIAQEARRYESRK